ncbi:hypothetical protein C4J81_01730 [Deltaproteobacteria bacterium Smac51]|nr:hypothetical protein C4J81_01730 [Deltaproteobacteria bacterium Smac51]
MIRPAKKPHFSRFLAFISMFLFLPCPSVQAAAPNEAAGTATLPAVRTQAETEALQQEFLKLKKKFEQDAQKTKEQKTLTTLALETTAQSWALAASFIGSNDAELRNKKTAIDKAMASKNWDSREMAALEYYYEALFAMTRKAAQNKSQAPLLVELDSIAAKTAEQLAGLKGKPDAALEKRVVLSGSLTGIMAVAVKSVGGGAMEQPIQLIVKETLSKANAVSARPDIHYRAKLSLLYANNVHGLTALTFLLGHNAGPPLSNELAKVHNAWNTHVRDASLPDTMSLTWTAQCQAALPLSFWLATH